MAKKTTKTKTIPKKKPAKKRKKPVQNKWNDQYKAVSHLMEVELQGLIQYLRAIHYFAVILIVSGIVAMIYSLRVLFQDEQHAVIGFLVIILTLLAVVITSAWVLRPWVLPRFLLPMDLSQLDIKQLLSLFKEPEEYLKLIIEHTEALTEQFLLPKLRRLRNSIVILIFGISTAMLLSIMLP